MSRQPRPRDEGQSLILALVVLVVISLIVLGLASFASVSSRRAVVTRDRVQAVNAADAGIRAAIEHIRTTGFFCADPGAGSGTPYRLADPLLAGRPGGTPVSMEVTVTCTLVSGTVAGVNGWAMVLTGETVPGSAATKDLLLTQGGAGRLKKIGGPVFMEHLNQGNFDTQAPLQIDQGNLVGPTPSCDPAVLPKLGGDVTVTPTPPFGLLCLGEVRPGTPMTWTNLVRRPSLPDFATMAAVTDPPVGTRLVGGVPTACKVYTPGRYTVPLTLANQASYFASGVYSFSNVDLDIDKGFVVGGTPINDAAETEVLSGTNPCNGARDSDQAVFGTVGVDPPVPISSRPGVTGFGVTWILEGTSTVFVGNQAGLELFRRCADQATCGSGGLDLFAVVTAGPTTDNAAGYTPSSVTAGSGSAVIAQKSGQPSDMVLHGGAWVPQGRIEFGNVTNTANAQLLGGLVAAQAVLQASASAANFVISVDGAPFETQYKLRSTATNGRTTVSAVAVVQVDNSANRRYAVNSWRIEGPGTST
jgi:hypothetical protein